MKDGSWAEVRGGPHLHTVTRSEGHEGGGGIGVASISLAHPCMAPGLLSAWGGGATWGQMGRGGGEKGEIRQGHQTLGKREGDRTEHSPKGQAQGKVMRKGKDTGGVSRRQTNGTEESDGMGMHQPTLQVLPAPAGALCLPASSAYFFPSETPTHRPLLSLFSPTKPLLFTGPHPTLLAHTPPHFLGARAPPPLQTCSAHPAAAGRTQHSCQGQHHWGLQTPEGWGAPGNA